jgi:hypothetical protein
MTNPIITRRTARESGASRYFTGNTCPSGHVADRHVVNGRCCECNLAWKARNQDKVRSYGRSLRARNPEKMRDQGRRRYWADVERQREKARNYATKNKAIIKERVKAGASRPEEIERIRVYRAEYTRRPEVASRRRELCNLRLQTDVCYLLSQRVRSRIVSALRSASAGKKSRRRWQELFGYTVDELRVHLERQFVKGMSWRNRERWHIDHILPLSSFRFESVDDPEFKAAWAITNLRPLWKPDNLKKGSRRVVLL